MLKELLEELWEPFQIVEIMSSDSLSKCERTTFTWTTKPGGLCLAVDKKYFKQAVSNEQIGGIVAYRSALKEPVPTDKAIIVSEKAAELFYRIHNEGIHRYHNLSEPPNKTKIAETASIASTSVICNNVVIGENVVVSDGCVISSNTIIEDNTIIHPNVTIGSDGLFGKKILGKKTCVKHHGGVWIGKNCAILPGANVARSANFGEFTIVEDEVYIGVHSAIGHDCIVGSGTDISAKVILAGRVKVGKSCWIGAGAIVSNALRIGDNASVRIGAVVISNVSEDANVSGNFALDHHKNLRNFVESTK